MRKKTKTLEAIHPNVFTSILSSLFVRTVEPWEYVMGVIERARLQFSHQHSPT